MAASSYSQKARRSLAGFTIIEIMLVLVIAAAIILMVFLAVPTIQRNSRNNRRENDAARVLSAAKEWSVNNNNKLPHCNDMQGRTEGSIPECIDGSREEIEQLAGKLSYYENVWSVSQVEYNQYMFADDSLINPEIVSYVDDNVLVRTRTNCTENNSVTNGGGMVVLYSYETADGLILKCRG